jgi:hypothetical protein
LETDAVVYSAYWKKEEGIPHTRNNWLCHDFKDRRIVPSQYAIQSHFNVAGHRRLRSYRVEMPADGMNWPLVGYKEDNNGSRLTWTFPVAESNTCRFIRVGIIGRNHIVNEAFVIQTWGIFGSLIEQTISSSDAANVSY